MPEVKSSSAADSSLFLDREWRHRFGLKGLGVKHQLRAVRYLVVYPSEDFPSSDVHREALVRGLLSPFF
jgi:hypothetical protein